MKAEMPVGYVLKLKVLTGKATPNKKGGTFSLLFYLKE